MDVPRKQRNKKTREDVSNSDDSSHDSPATPTGGQLFHSLSAPSLRTPSPHHLHSAPFSVLHVPRSSSPSSLTPNGTNSFVWSHSQPPLHHSPQVAYPPSPTTGQERTPGPRLIYPVLPNYTYPKLSNYYPSPTNKHAPNGYSSELHDFLLPNSDITPANYSLNPLGSHADALHYSHSYPTDPHSASSSGSTNCGFIPSHFNNSPPSDDPSSPPSNSHAPYLSNPSLTWHTSTGGSGSGHSSSNTDAHSPPHNHHNLNINIHNNSLHLNHSTHNSHHSTHNTTNSVINNISSINQINHIINIHGAINAPPPSSNSSNGATHSAPEHSNNGVNNSLHNLGSFNSTQLSGQMLQHGPSSFPQPLSAFGDNTATSTFLPLQNSYPTEEPTFMIMMSSRVLVDCNPGFARLLGYDSPTSLVLGNGLVVLEELSPPQFQKYVINIWKNAIEQGTKSFDKVTAFKTRAGNVIFCTFTANVLTDNMHGIAVITQVLDYSDLPPVRKSKSGDVSFF